MTQTATPTTTRPTTTARRRPIRYQTGERDLSRVRTRGQAFRPGGDVYFALLTIPFWRFCAVVAALVLVLNSIFAWIYTLNPGGISNARPGSFADAFFFSVQTMATIGYGTMAPRSFGSHIMVSIEALSGLTSLAVVTGLVFARFSRPTARVRFSRVAVVAPRDGVPALMFRAVNQR